MFESNKFVQEYNSNAYYTEIKDVKFLSHEEEMMYAKNYIENGDVESGNKIIHANLKLAASIARGYVGYGIPVQDLIQEANIGMLKALKKFNPDLGFRFSTLATTYIKSAIHDYVVKNSRMVKIATTKPQRKLFFNLRSMKHSDVLQKDEIAKISAELNVTPEDVISMDYRLQGVEFSLHSITKTEDGDHYTFEDFLMTDDSDPYEIISGAEQVETMKHLIDGALGLLDERSLTVIKRRVMSEGEKASTLKDLSEEFNISLERVRQIEVNAMRKIRSYMMNKREYTEAYD